MQAMKFAKLLFLSVILTSTFFICSCFEKTPEEIAQMNKRKTELAVRRAQVMLAEDNVKGAISMLENAYRECGASLEICEALANAFAQDGQTASAGMFYEQAFDCNNARVDLIVFAATSYEQSDSLDAAISAYEKLLQKNSNDANALKSIAKIYQKQNNFQKALNAYLACLKAQNRNPDTSEAATIGSLFVKMGNIAQGKLWLETALSVTIPSNIETRKEIGLSLIHVYLERKDMKNLEKTIAMLDSIDAELVNKNFPELRGKLAEFKRQLAEVEAQLTAIKTRQTLEAEQAEEQKQKEAEAKRIQQKIEEEKLAQQKKEKELEAKKEAEKLSEKEKPQNKTNEQSAENKKQEPEKENIQTDVITEQSTPVDVQKKPEAKPETQKSDFQIYLEKTKEYVAKKDAKNALEYATKTITENPSSDYAWHLMAEAFELNKLTNDAYLAAYEAYLIKKIPQNAVFMLQYAKKDQNKETFLQTVLSVYEKFPNHEDIIFEVASAYRANNNTVKAKEFYNKYLQTETANEQKNKEAKDFLK